MFLFEEAEIRPAKIKVIGVGGSGCNAVNTMIASKFSGVEFISANTDVQALSLSKAPCTLPMGARLTKGLGAGANPNVGREAALEDAQKIREMLEGADMVFVTAGMGGGTGTGAAPIIANVARELGALTVAVVTKPFQFEGALRMRRAEEGIDELKKVVDSLIVIPNQRLLSIVDKTASVPKSFKMVDDVLRQAVQGIADLVTTPGLVNVDFADVRTVMAHMGRAVMGMGFARGDHRAVEAAQRAISSPLLEEDGIHGARGVLLNITGGEGLSLHEVSEASTIIQEAADPEANIIFGSVINKQMKEDVIVTVIATGFDKELIREEPVKSAASKPVPSKSLDRPAFLRKVANSGYPPGGLNVDDEWDVPTFLRKQAD
ncbi:MAG TPA: cell division protein FtsZ [Nitrospiria bacterium]|jgi:cell division protein FtsZ|nr:cell division protein FtsZ [Nitrospiria bacterium]